MTDTLTVIQAACALYKAPFTAKYGYIYDANNKMVADDEGRDTMLRIRGWGHIQKLPDAAAVQDMVAELIVAALNKYWTELPPLPEEQG